VGLGLRKNDQNGQIEHFVHFDYICSMAIVSATQAKQNFAALLDQAQREPVRIQRHERDVAVLVSAEEWEKVHRMRVQEAIRISEENGRYAESQGMTDELLEELLADE
jgi:prevent-host-death family protein